MVFPSPVYSDRAEVIAEIVSTERAYSDDLRVIVDVFLRPLQVHHCHCRVDGRR